VPEVATPRTLGEFLAKPARARMRILLAPGADLSLGTAARGAESVELLVGPEGGLEDGERRAALAAGFLACRLGPRVLRSETAAIAAIAVLQAAAGDL
jgi:16S rRNA (uracil1498-N3)-methyltransferase